MDRLFCMLMLCLMLTPAAQHPAVMPAQPDSAQPVFFSMLFPQLIPDGLMEQTDREAVTL